MEHVPPKCLFPEKKDSDGYDHRVELITVPSCDEHNLRKAKDDEFLMVCVAGIIGSNSIGYQHRLNKVNRAIRRTADRLLGAAFRARKHILVELEENAFLEVILGTPDYERLEGCFQNIARALYFHHFKSRFDGEVKVLMGHLFHTDKNAATFSKLIQHRANLELQDKGRLGRNSEVFSYQFSNPDEYGLIMLHMCFYGGVNIFTTYLPVGTALPSNPATTFIDAGIETYVDVGGRIYKFNG